MHRLHRYSLLHPGRTVLGGVFLAILLATGLTRLELRTDGRALASAESPVVRFDEEVRHTFGLRDPLVVLLRSRSPEGIFDPFVLEKLEALTHELRALPGIDSSAVMSLATEKSGRRKPGTLRFRTFLEPFPDTEEELRRLRDDVHEVGLFGGTLLSFDETATAILVGVPGTRDRAELLEKVAAVAMVAASESLEIQVIGAPAAEVLLGNHILRDLGIPTRGLSGGEDTSGTEPGFAFRRVVRRIGLMPVALAVMALVFLVSFRSPAAVALPLTEVAACLGAVFGIMGWLGVPVYLSTAVLPIILTAIAVADEVHIFSRYAQLRRADPGAAPRTCVREAMDEMARPIVLTSLTTFAGFLSFAVSPVVPVRTFGLFAALGISFCLLWSLTVIPALLTLLGERAFTPSPRPTRDLARRGRSQPGLFVRLLTRRRRSVLAGFSILTALSAAGIFRVTVQDSWIGGFSPKSAFRKATEFFDRQFLGTHLLHVVLETDPVEVRGETLGIHVEDHRLRIPRPSREDPGILRGCALRIIRQDLDRAPEPGSIAPRVRQAWSSWIAEVSSEGEHVLLSMPAQDGSPRSSLKIHDDDSVHYEIESRPFLLPSVLHEVRRLEEFVEDQRELSVGGVLGPGQFLETTRFLVGQRDPGLRAIPDDRRLIGSLWHNYGVARGRGRLREIVDADFRRTLMTAYLKNANFAETARLMQVIRDYGSRHLEPLRIRTRFAGDVAISQSLIEGIVSTQVRSLLLSLVAIFAIASLVNRSLRWGLLSILPCAFAVAVIFAVMGASSIPLGIATSMFAGMTLGVGVDFAIHLIDRFRRAHGRGVSVEVALDDALQVVGPAVLIDGLAVALGFGVLLFSSVPPNARLGGLTAICVLTCLMTTLVLLPALIAPRPT